MNDDYNPYAPPTHTDVSPRRTTGEQEPDARGYGGSEAWQENGQVVLAKEGGVLPNRCVVCNERTDEKLRKTFMWHPPGYYLLILAGWIFYLIAVLFVRKSATVELGLCREHNQRRKNGLLILWMGIIVGFVLLIAGAKGSTPIAVVLGLCVVVIGPIVGGIMSRVASPAKIDDTHIWLKAGAPFVASLPDSPDEEPDSEPRPVKKKKRRARRPVVEE